EPAREVQAIEAALDRQVDGIVFAAMRTREVFVPDVPTNTPVVMLNGTSSRFKTSVLPDEFEGGRFAVSLLHAAGIRDGIALIGHNEMVERGLFRSETVARRLAGIRHEMAARNLGFIAEESCWEWEPHHGYEIVSRLLRQGTAPKALLCLNDRIAFGAYQALAEAGLSIPGNVSVVSFDDDEIAAYLRPGLTTIALPHEQMGRESIGLLLARQDAIEILVPMPLVRRGSLPS
ncbi:MAG: substrate-binding domain-containing protein, partial [Devosia sp.]